MAHGCKLVTTVSYFQTLHCLKSFFFKKILDAPEITRRLFHGILRGKSSGILLVIHSKHYSGKPAKIPPKIAIKHSQAIIPAICLDIPQMVSQDKISRKSFGSPIMELQRKFFQKCLEMHFLEILSKMIVLISFVIVLRYFDNITIEKLLVKLTKVYSSIAALIAIFQIYFQWFTEPILQQFLHRLSINSSTKSIMNSFTNFTSSTGFPPKYLPKFRVLSKIF